MKDMTYAEACEKADALKTLEVGEVYLRGYDDEMPWHIADDCEDYGRRRMGINTSVWFCGTCPKTGLRFRWIFDIEIEECSDDGEGYFEIDADGCRDIMTKLKGQCRKKFQAYLLECAEKYNAKCAELQAILKQYKREVAILRNLAKAQELEK